LYFCIVLRFNLCLLLHVHLWNPRHQISLQIFSLFAYFAILLLDSGSFMLNKLLCLFSASAIVMLSYLIAGGSYSTDICIIVNSYRAPFTPPLNAQPHAHPHRIYTSWLYTIYTACTTRETILMPCAMRRTIVYSGCW
jgi:hypothetical protein